MHKEPNIARKRPKERHKYQAGYICTSYTSRNSNVKSKQKKGVESPGAGAQQTSHTMRFVELQRIIESNLNSGTPASSHHRNSRSSIFIAAPDPTSVVPSPSLLQATHPVASFPPDSLDKVDIPDIRPPVAVVLYSYNSAQACLHQQSIPS